jgi:hypothetical protein
MANGWNGGDPPAVVFTYAPGRSGSHAMDILTGFNGILQGEEGQQTVRGTVCPTNGYAGHVALAEPRRVGGTPLMLAYCWAHARRKLHDIYQKDGVVLEARLWRDDRRRGPAPHCPDLQDRSQHMAFTQMDVARPLILRSRRLWPTERSR